jgi:hypothetical protein
MFTQFRIDVSMACFSCLEYKTLAAIMYIYQLLKYIESSNSSLVSLLYLHSLMVAAVGYVKSITRLTQRKKSFILGDIKVFSVAELKCQGKALPAYSRLLKRTARPSAHRYHYCQDGQPCCRS